VARKAEGGEVAIRSHKEVCTYPQGGYQGDEEGSGGQESASKENRQGSRTTHNESCRIATAWPKIATLNFCQPFSGRKGELLVARPTSQVVSLTGQCIAV